MVADKARHRRHQTDVPMLSMGTGVLNRHIGTIDLLREISSVRPLRSAVHPT